jgi:hypothetical protein
MIEHYQNGIWQWKIGHHNGIVKSMWTQEVFQVMVLNKWEIPTPELFIWRGNLIGNNGSHYVAEYTIDYVDGAFIPGTFKLIRAVCPGND